ncbi:hypothetical protein OAU52_00460 [bacterium]|nr:hypothetical protein [bacterium]
MNLITPNLAYRNWTSLGVLGGTHEAMVDPVGAVSQGPYSWSVIPFFREIKKLKNEGERITPVTMNVKQISQKRLTCKAGVLTQYNLWNGLTCRTECRAVKYAGHDLLLNTWVVSNLSSTRQNLEFGGSIRAHNPLGMGHINKIKFKNDTWRVNRKTGVILLNKPDGIAVGNRQVGDPLRAESFAPHSSKKTNLHSSTGVAGGIFEYHKALAPGENAVIHFAIHLDKEPKASVNELNLLNDEIADQLIETHDLDWSEKATQGLEMNFGHKKWNDLFVTLKNHLHTFDDQDRLSPGTYLYHTSWLRDSAFLSEAFHMMSLGSLMDQKVKRWLSLQKPNGFFQSQKGEWDSTGQALWMLCRHLKYRENNLDEEDAVEVELTQIKSKIAKAGKKATAWVAKVCDKSQNGLLPAGFSAEHFGPNDQYYWDDFWTLAGLQEFVVFCEDNEKYQSKIVETQRVITVLRENLESSIERVMDKEKGILSSSPNREKDSACIGILVACAPLNLYEFSDPIIKNTADYLVENHLHKNLFFHQVFHTGYNIYLTIQLAKVLLRAQNPKWIEILEAVLKVASPTATWPEAIHPQTLGGCMGDGDHGWATAEMLCFFRETLLIEDSKKLILGSGIDYHLRKNKKAFSSKSPMLEIKKAATMAGSFSASWNYLKTDTQERISLDCLIENQNISLVEQLVQVKIPEGWKSFESPLWSNSNSKLSTQGEWVEILLSVNKPLKIEFIRNEKKNEE